MRKSKIKFPKPVSLIIRIAPAFPEPLDDGRWSFDCTIPTIGSPNIRIIASNPNEARAMLEDFIFNELEGSDDLKS